jgi:ketosteroid isomerase-like protein
MRRILIPLVVAAWAAAPVVASEENDVMAVMRQWTGLFRHDTANAALATCADDASIIDDIPPYVWLGSGACARWANVLFVESEKSAVTDLSSVLLNPRHIQITADRAYAVVPINFTFKLNGKTIKETGTVLTAALEKVPAGWRITAMAIAEH